MSDFQKRSVSNIVFFALLAAILAIYVFILKPLNQGQEGEKHPAIGALLPALSLDPLDLSARPLASSELAGKVVLINFWATWCEPCQMEFPKLVTLEKQLRDDPDFRMLSISCPGQGETEDELRTSTEAYLKQRTVDMPVYVDPFGVAFHAIARATATDGSIPLTMVVDRSGVIRGIWIGYRPGSEQTIQALIQRLLTDNRETNSATAAPGSDA